MNTGFQPLVLKSNWFHRSIPYFNSLGLKNLNSTALKSTPKSNLDERTLPTQKTSTDDQLKDLFCILEKDSLKYV